MLLATLLGLLLTIFPVPGVTSLLIVGAGLRLSTNIPIMIAVSYIATPLQFWAMMPFIHLGEKIMGVRHTLLTVEAIKTAFDASFFSAAKDLSLEVICGISGWAVFSIPLALVFFVIFRFQEMKKLFFKSFIAVFSMVVFQNCMNQNAPEKTMAAATFAAAKLAPVAAENYWYQGKAEISTFDVQQARYGENRTAEQVNVFVTEDFSAKKQVKLDDAPAAGTDRVPVLKLNAIRRFTTGIYDYSLMFSVFSPNQTPTSRALKTTWTVQDWCGQVFEQTNLQPDGGYRLRQFSYFEKEGDTDQSFKPELLEDEIWTALRIDPARFSKMDAVNVLPSTLYFRFQHKPFKTEKASILIEKGQTESTLRLAYADIARKLDIRFETAAPHRILGWEETDGGKTTSKGVLKKTILTDYWARHDNASEPLRDSISLHFFQ